MNSVGMILEDSLSLLCITNIVMYSTKACQKDRYPSIKLKFIFFPFIYYLFFFFCFLSFKKRPLNHENSILEKLVKSLLDGRMLCVCVHQRSSSDGIKRRDNTFQHTTPVGGKKSTVEGNALVRRKAHVGDMWRRLLGPWDRINWPFSVPHRHFQSDSIEYVKGLRHNGEPRGSSSMEYIGAETEGSLAAAWIATVYITLRVWLPMKGFSSMGEKPLFKR